MKKSHLVILTLTLLATRSPSPEDAVNAVRHNAGIAHLKLGDPKIAFRKFRRAAGLRLDVALYVHNQGLALRQAGRNQEAHEALGDLYFAAKQYAAARAAWERAIDLAEAPPALTKLARVRLVQPRDLNAATANINDALKIDPGYAPAYYARGLLAELDADWAEAEKNFRAARKLDPNLFEAYFKHAVALVELSRPADAVNSLEAFIKNAPPEKYMQQIVAARVEINRLQSSGRAEASIQPAAQTHRNSRKP
jgi:tetratricopeptide (TPR) repeat protein